MMDNGVNARNFIGYDSFSLRHAFIYPWIRTYYVLCVRVMKWKILKKLLLLIDIITKRYSFYFRL